MNNTVLSDLAHQAADPGEPHASILTPDVRSGASFTFAGGGSTHSPPFLVVWFYTVDVPTRASFMQKVAAYEASGLLPQSVVPAVAGVTYRGTYSVSISGAAPDFEYRTVWGLDDLAKLQTLNDHLRAGPAQLKEVLERISQVRAMRSEIMGLTRNSASFMGDAP